MRLEAAATLTPAIHEVACGQVAAASCRFWASADNTPVWFIPATRMNRPATSGSAPQETSLRIGSGDCRPMNSTMAVNDAPAQNVGKPSDQSNADAESSITTVSAIPIAEASPLNAIGGPPSIVAPFAPGARRCVSRNATY